MKNKHLTSMSTIKIDPEELEEILDEIAVSFQVNFDEKSIHNLVSVQEISELVLSKMPYEKGTHCSSQLLFYTLRNRFSELFQIPKKEITPTLRLKALFPLIGRRKKWNATFKTLTDVEFKLEPSIFSFVLLIGSILLFISTLAFQQPIFLFSTIISFSVALLLFKYPTRLPAKNLGELIKKTVIYQYSQSRSKVGTYNEREVMQTVLAIFSDWMNKKQLSMLSPKMKIDFEK